MIKPIFLFWACGALCFQALEVRAVERDELHVTFAQCKKTQRKIMARQAKLHASVKNLKIGRSIVHGAFVTSGIVSATGAAGIVLVASPVGNMAVAFAVCSFGNGKAVLTALCLWALGTLTARACTVGAWGVRSKIDGALKAHDEVVQKDPKLLRLMATYKAQKSKLQVAGLTMLSVEDQESFQRMMAKEEILKRQGLPL